MQTLAIVLLLAPMQAGAAGSVDYAVQVKPLLATRCYACHGALKQEAGLRLDTAASIRKGGESGPAVMPGASGDSLLVDRVSEPDADLRMPPEGDGTPLDTEQIALVRAWIDQGAIGPADEKPEADPRDHWAFRPPQRPAVPKVRQPDWVRNPIDAFLAAEREQRGLTPQPAADKRLLLRRVYLDLIGLPPTLDELEAFAADTSPEAYERVVDRLLESPQYGERWGRHWMDIWRYSDWWGLGAEVRNSQKHIWHWRDWIVESLNGDVGYDEMLREMLAADELYPNDPDKLRATGYLARHYFRFNRNTWLGETIEHTSKAMLGLTLNCTRCHDHKYDPFRQEDYYRLRAFFEPYQVRTDQVAGQSDYEKDGIPRAFDCHLDAPTYVFIRGDEKRPDKDRPVEPGVPDVLVFDKLQIAPVTMPLEAHVPGLRPWVLENALEDAQAKIAAARSALDQVRQTLAKAQQAAAAAPDKPTPSGDDKPAAAQAPSAGGKVLVEDDFGPLTADQWDQVGGQWKYEEGRLLQTQDGPQRGILRLKAQPPADFEVRFDFTITGGQMWKSVGIAFDVAGENELLAYLSAVSGGSKVQLTYKQGKDYVYPPGAAQARPVKLGQPQQLVVRVRGTLVNVLVNGQPALVWRSPIVRQPGHMDLITYDAQAAFTGFQLAELPAGVKLDEPGGAAASADTAAAGMPTLDQARAAVAAAEKALAAVEAQPDAIRARAAATRATTESPDDPQTKELARQAVRAERQAAAATAAASLAASEHELLRAAAAKKGEAEKKVAAARQALEGATKAIGEPSEKFTPLRGAVKTIESPVESAASLNAPFPATSTGRRSALARWMTDRRNPLTARVAVNHIWMRHFGTPLVATVFDFGRKGTPPTHPALLDWLAVELMDHGWSMKHLHRLMVTSKAYRMSSSTAGAEANVARDQENHYYWRMNAGRMEAQVIRDALLHLSGGLDPAMGGPPLPVGQPSQRRSLYFVHSHNDHQQFLSVFDDASVQECYRREQSIVPQQALALSNSKTALEAAKKVATALAARPECADDAGFIRAAFVALLASTPSDAEVQTSLEAFQAWAAAAGGVTNDAARMKARANFVLALMNHNDFITIR